jgi:hypothetical protein
MTTLYFPASPGALVVDIFIRGQRIFSGIDVASLAGLGGGVFALNFTAYSPDGMIDIEIIATTGLPILAALERVHVPMPRFELRVDSGGTEPYVDTAGRTWLQDMFFDGGMPNSVCPAAIGGTDDDDLYCSELYGTFKYTVPVPALGFYRVILHLAEVECKYRDCIYCCYPSCC